jgi:hemoglobin-like flavoprotein
MDQEKIRLVHESWGLIEPRGPELARSFYARLFALDPVLEDLFALAEMDSQGEKFMTMLAEVIRMVQDPESFEAVLAASGRRHVEYGVVSRHYHVVGEALLWALDDALPEGFDGATREAWAEAYTRMAFIMQSGARGEGATGPAGAQVTPGS